MNLRLVGTAGVLDGTKVILAGLQGGLRAIVLLQVFAGLLGNHSGGDLTSILLVGRISDNLGLLLNNSVLGSGCTQPGLILVLNNWDSRASGNSLHVIDLRLPLSSLFNSVEIRLQVCSNCLLLSVLSDAWTVISVLHLAESVSLAAILTVCGHRNDRLTDASRAPWRRSHVDVGLLGLSQLIGTIYVVCSRSHGLFKTFFASLANCEALRVLTPLIIAIIVVTWAET